MVIYKITNKINSKIYIGQTIEPSRRWNFHKKARTKTYISRAIFKHGCENFEFTIIEVVSNKEQLDERECFWIKELNSLAPNGYNLEKGGNSSGKVSEVTKEKISIGLKKAVKEGRLIPYNAKGEKNGMYGKKHSEETKLKQSVRAKDPRRAAMFKEAGKKTWVKIQDNNGIIHESQSHAAKTLNISRESIRCVLNGTFKQVKGYTFKKVKDEN